MIIDSGVLSQGTELQCDLCIVGGGAAGISIALEMIGTGLDVVLLEAGFIGFDDRAQSLYDGPNLGIDSTALVDSRLRMLGGSTNHWAGNSMPLEPIDFEERPGIPHSGWPITRQDLDPYYLRAQARVETPSDGLYDTPENAARLDFNKIDFDPAKLESFIFAESPPTAFGYVYEDQLRAAQNVRVILNASALEVATNDTASEVTGIRASGLDGPEFRVTARKYILAAGGIEIPRLLLLSNAVQTAGLGNGNDLVGRFFMDHASIRPPMTVLLPDKGAHLRPYIDSTEVEGGYLRGAIRASADILRKEQLPNFLFFTFVNPQRSPGKIAMLRLKQALQGREIDHLGMHLQNVLTDMDGATNALFQNVRGDKQDLIDRNWFEPWLVVESIPEPDSRVVLIDERDDIFGQRRCGLDWRFHEGTLPSYRRATEILAEEMGRLGYGRVWSQILRDDSEWPGPIWHGKHHCGTTRMSNDPRTGVVDANCKAHGISNLYISSSSVFPTHGAATPTLTITAMAIRLADHLKEAM
ncbi:GMC oxidoreductase [Actibacterium ureilyticum]|uniref:GMC oxidoreductase n=1 Tax=Actibacterium ureilyticum TaxID=1590614 RepID=UPI000BAAF019|nr:GMC family oxidoreductase [Actibacterium ureilyticum]